MFDNSFPTCAFFFHFCHSLGQDQSTIAQPAEMTVAECSLMSCVLARFLIGSHTMLAQRHSQPTPTSLCPPKYARKKDTTFN